MIKIVILNPHQQSKEELKSIITYLQSIVVSQTSNLPQITDTPVAEITLKKPLFENKTTPNASYTTGELVETTSLTDFKSLEDSYRTYSEAKLNKAIEKPIEDNEELDSTGMPWDASIHSRKKTKTVNGTWRMLRNADPIKVTQVKGTTLIEEELIPAPPSFTKKTLKNPEDKTAFMNFMSKITEAVKNKKLTHKQIAEAVNIAGVSSVADVACNLEALPMIMMLLDRMLSGESISDD